MKTVLTIAGSDSSGGAGIQADIKTIEAHGLFATSAITALTAQNTLGVSGVLDVDPAFVVAQIDAVFEDIRPDAVKIGMVSSPEIVRAIACALKRCEARHVVVDPVMVATSGSALIDDDAVSSLVEHLFPLAEVVTPNIPEARVLSGGEIASESDVESAARLIAGLVADPSRPSVLVKGGHGVTKPDSADDGLLLSDGSFHWLRGSRVDTANTHGTGCTLSSAIACGLACDLDVREAVVRAKTYVTGALCCGLDLGRGSGPLDHMWCHPRVLEDA